MISLLVILGPLIIIDSQYYGNLTLAPFNIVKYNIFSSHGPDLYGTEPWYFYIINGCLNFNVIFPRECDSLKRALIQSSLCILFLVSILVLPAWTITKLLINMPKRSNTNAIPPWLIHFALYSWLAIFTFQPHKEERFLYPVYPLICLAGASTIDYFQKIFFHFFVKIKSNHYLDHTTFISLGNFFNYNYNLFYDVNLLYQRSHCFVCPGEWFTRILNAQQLSCSTGHLDAYQQSSFSR